MLRPAHLWLLLLTAYLLVFGYNWWARLPRFPLTLPASEIVLRPADLSDSWQPVASQTRVIADNPYEDFTAHFRSGFRAEFTGSGNSAWRTTRIVSTSFLVDLKGAEQIYRNYTGSIRHRGEVQPLPALGTESLFVVAHSEPAAPVMMIGVVRVQNALITLTVMTDQPMDPAQIYTWAALLVERARQ